MKRVPCKEEDLKFYVGSTRVSGHSKSMRPILLRVYAEEEEKNNSHTEHRFIGLKEGKNMYVVPLSDPTTFFKVKSYDTIGTTGNLPMGIPCREMYTSSSDWNLDERFKVLNKYLLTQNEKSIFNRIYEMLPEFEPLKTWFDLPGAFWFTDIPLLY